MKILKLINGTFVNFKYFIRVNTINFNSLYVCQDESYDFLNAYHEKATKEEWAEAHQIALKIILDYADDSIIDMVNVTDQAIEILAGLKSLRETSI